MCTTVAQWLPVLLSLGMQVRYLPQRVVIITYVITKAKSESACVRGFGRTLNIPVISKLICRSVFVFALSVFIMNVHQLAQFAALVRMQPYPTTRPQINPLG